ncbi:WD and tetratricopeptide repeats protein 1 [Nymphon striatum]|nr:WD and tetratricopeptide repeats protein 1 [Nymphon striatum]
MAVNSLAKLEQLKQIQGHNGCVNCIEWNERGDRLISGSDDVNVILWDPFRHKKLQTLQTGHYGNIFSVKFLPSTDNTIITGAADSRIRMHDLVACETTHVWSCHSGRVKRIATSPNVPHIFWSASEDGLIMQFDTRCPDRSSKVLINLLIHMGENAEAKCIAVNPTFPELIAVGANDPYARIFDRRLIKPFEVKYPSDYSGMNNWARVNFAKDRFLDSNKEQGMIPKSSVKYCVAVIGIVCLAFIDYKKEFDSVEHQAVLNALNVQNIPPAYIRMLDQIFGLGTSNIKLHTNTNKIRLEKGVRQGDSISPKLFTACLETVFRGLNWTSKGIPINGDRLTNLRFADDVVLFSESPQELQLMDEELRTASSKVGLEINLRHLPLKLKEYKEKHRSLASTYLTFSPDGSELLVNLGGEQIYLFNVGESTYPKIFSTELYTSKSKNDCHNDLKNIPKNGTTNGFTSNGVAKHIGTLKPDLHESKKFKKSLTENEALPPLVEKIKSRANDAFNRKEYTVAISLYNEALQRMPHAAILYSNRAAALLKRQWDGDVYSAMNDCHSALKYNSNHIKAHFRLIRCLYELNRIQEADLCLKSKVLLIVRLPLTRNCLAMKKIGGKMPTIITSRFCGHCNTTTDIKEVNFFGSNGQYIVAGSDDGSFFVWDKKTSNIKRIMKGDDSIVNCLQPHPSYCLLASSGIDPVVRLWSPKPEDGSKNDRDVKDLELAAKDNQRRMNADPLEVMLMNMGYRFHPSDPDDLQGDSAETDVDRCRQS